MLARLNPPGASDTSLRAAAGEEHLGSPLKPIVS